MRVVEEPLNRTTIDAITRLIVERFEPEQIILFGSCARGDTDENSDLDLLVVLCHNDEQGQPRAIAIRLAIAENFVLPVDVLIRSADVVDKYRRDPNSMISRMLEDSEVLHDRHAPPEQAWFAKADDDLEIARRALGYGRSILDLRPMSLLPRPSNARRNTARANLVTNIDPKSPGHNELAEARSFYARTSSQPFQLRELNIHEIRINVMHRRAHASHIRGGIKFARYRP